MSSLVFWRSFREPVRTPGVAVALVAFAILVWLVGIVTVNLNVVTASVLGSAVSWLVRNLVLIMFVPAFILAASLIRSEASDGTLLLALFQPLSRETYYLSRVLGRALLALLYFGVTSLGLYLCMYVYVASAFPDQLRFLPPDLFYRVVMSGLSLVTVVFSLAALACLVSGRFTQLAIWGGLFYLVHEGSAAAANPFAPAWRRVAGRVVEEVLAPFLTGASATFAAEAALGPWYLHRAMLQWGFGTALALAAGLFAFSKMEVGLRR